MGDFSVFHWLIVLALILALCGGNRLVEMARYLGAMDKRWTADASASGD